MRRLIGWWRLRWGYCPQCNSSPPDRHCPVCAGAFVYGRRNLDARTRLLWKTRFQNLHKKAEK